MAELDGNESVESIFTALASLAAAAASIHLGGERMDEASWEARQTLELLSHLSPEFAVQPVARRPVAEANAVLAATQLAEGDPAEAAEHADAARMAFAELHDLAGCLRADVLMARARAAEGSVLEARAPRGGPTDGRAPRRRRWAGGCRSGDRRTGGISVRIIQLEDVQVGSPLGQALFNDRGDVLAQAGVTLDDTLLRQIKTRGYTAVFVEDKQSEGVEVHDPLSPVTRARVTKISRNTIAVGEQVVARMGPQLAGNVTALPRSDELKRTIAQGVQSDAILESVGNIVDEVLDGPTMLGLNSIKALDNFAFSHSVEVASVAVMVGRKLGYKPADLKRLGRGALLHDIGQTFTGDTTDGKTGSPTPADVEQVKRHTRLGFDFLQSVPKFDALTNHVAYQHHEWFNGKGYPRGLVGTQRFDRTVSVQPGEITTIAQVTAIADVYDALCSDRPFRQRLPRELALSLIKRMAEAALHPELVTTFLELVPIFPPGYPVRVVGGALDKWQGIVAKSGSPDINRPLVRLFVKPDGEEVEPFELDLSRDSAVRLMTAPPKRRTATPS
jgi:putative nucleotidyltransferase with HDIG domain